MRFHVPDTNFIRHWCNIEAARTPVGTPDVGSGLSHARLKVHHTSVDLRYDSRSEMICRGLSAHRLYRPSKFAFCLNPMIGCCRKLLLHPFDSLHLAVQFCSH